MAADTLEGKREAIVTEYMLRILGLDVSISLLSEGKWPCLLTSCTDASAEFLDLIFCSPAAY